MTTDPATNASRSCLFAALMTVLLSAHAFAGPSIGAVRVSPTTALVGTPTLVTVEASIADGSVLPNGVNLLQIGASGVARVLGTMHDDGQGGDKTPADGVFTIQVTLSAPVETSLPLQISAAFRNVLQRVRSETVPVYVQTADAPQRSIQALNQLLSTGDTANALTYVVPNANTVRAFDTFTSAQLGVLVSILNGATLLSTQPDQRTFVSSIPRPAGPPTPVTFTMRPGANGRWLLDKW